MNKVALTLALAMIVATPLWAQASRRKGNLNKASGLRAAITGRRAPAPSPTANPLDRLISVELDRVEAVEALRTVFRLTSVNFDMDDTISGWVTLSVKNQPERVALDNLTAQLGATWTPVWLKGRSDRRNLSSVVVLPYGGQRGRLVSGNPDVVFMKPNPRTEYRARPQIVSSAADTAVDGAQTADGVPVITNDMSSHYYPYYGPYGMGGGAYPSYWSPFDMAGSMSWGRGWRYGPYWGGYPGYGYGPIVLPGNFGPSVPFTPFAPGGSNSSGWVFHN